MKYDAERGLFVPRGRCEFVQEALMMGGGGAPAYDIFQLNASAVWGGGDGMAKVAEFQILDDVAGASILVGGTPGAGSYETIGGSYVPANAFDGNNATIWKADNAVSVEGVSTLNYHVGTSKRPRLLKLIPGNHLKTFTITAGLGSPITQLASVGNAGAGEPRLVTHIWANSGVYFYYPLLDLEMWFIQVTSGSSTWCTINSFVLANSVGGASLLTGGVATASSVISGSGPISITGWTSDVTNDPTSSGQAWLGYILPAGTALSPAWLSVTSGSFTTITGLALKKLKNGVVTTVENWAGLSWSANSTMSFTL